MLPPAVPAEMEASLTCWFAIVPCARRRATVWP